jgi:hypothetical protein
LGFGNLIGLEKFFKIVFYVAVFLIFLTCVRLSTKQVLNLAFVELFLLNVIFLELEIFFMHDLIFVRVNYKLDTRVQRFEDLVKGWDIGFLDFDQRFI